MLFRSTQRYAQIRSNPRFQELVRRRSRLAWSLTAAVLGGVGSLPGAMLGGLIIGLIEAFWSSYLSAEYKDVATFSILILVLMFRPSGLLGRPEVEKV